MKRWVIAAFVLACAAALHADGPGDNVPEKVRPIPPAGVESGADDRKALQQGLADLGDEIEALRKSLKPALRALLPDVEVYHKAVRYAVAYNEMFAVREVGVARALLDTGRERVKLLRAGKAPWTTATGLVVRGFVSRIDGSVQPYGLVVPASYRPGSPHRHRLDVWLHGRGEKKTELNFIDERQRSAGEFAPAHAFVLHPFGRYCNAFKFAGEIDVMEALAHVQKHYAIDEDRVVMRGFSMGGAGCWQFAVHYPGKWCAAAPGAGFSETADFLKVFQKEDYRPTWYERKLLHLYDCTDYAGNLFNCPVVAYSGADDPQKQAADRMAGAMKKDGLTLVHLIGPKTGHGYHPEAKKEIDRRIDRIAARGRVSVPQVVRFKTWTLRYNRAHWLTIDGLEKHWEEASVLARLVPTSRGSGTKNVVVSPQKNVTAFTVSFGPGECPVEITKASVMIGLGPDEAIEAAPILSDRSWTAHFRKEAGKWKAVKSADGGALRKSHGLQGPIDDAFMGSFLIVRPTGKPLNDKVGAWTKGEMNRAIDHWRKQFRGDARVKDDSAVTPADVAAHNLILWGDPSSNKVLGKIAGKLPVGWDAKSVRLGEETFDAAHHVPVLIYPNPLNPKRYVVLNSGFTYRDYDYLNNARQVPKLPDYAVLDVRTPPSSQWAGKVVAAGFFDETWKLSPAGK